MRPGLKPSSTASVPTGRRARFTGTAITLTGSDVETAAANLTFAVTSTPAHGALSGSAPNLTYTPAAGYAGADSFTYRLTDELDAQSAVATVSITVTAAPTPGGGGGGGKKKGGGSAGSSSEGSGGESKSSDSGSSDSKKSESKPAPKAAASSSGD